MANRRAQGQDQTSGQAVPERTGELLPHCLLEHRLISTYDRVVLRCRCAVVANISILDSGSTCSTRVQEPEPSRHTPATAAAAPAPALASRQNVQYEEIGFEVLRRYDEEREARSANGNANHKVRRARVSRLWRLPPPLPL
jgi:hypothetical protein